MIPKIIHYFWFGGNPMPQLALDCIESWKKYCPDYEIKLWNEDNYDIKKNQYMYQSYKCGKYGFTVDYARLDIIYHYGGVYLDTDVELIKPLDEFLNDSAFMGFETNRTVAIGLGFGAEAGNNTIFQMRELYNDLRFINKDGSLNLIPSPSYQTRVLRDSGMKCDGTEQVVDQVHIYPKEVFNPCDLETRRITVTPRTASIHHYMASWATESQRLHTKIYAYGSRMLGKRAVRFLRKSYRKMRIR